MSAPKVIRPSASLIVVAPVQRTELREGDANYKILLLKRNAKSSFVNAHVFPGGNLDEFDKDKAWRDMFPKESLLNEPYLMHKLCAIRETFEESGILLTEPLQPSLDAELTAWRDLVHNNAGDFHRLMTKYNMLPSISKLHHYSQWITPNVEPRRYNTHFFLTVLPGELSSASSAKITADGQETTKLDWFTPDEALSNWRNGDISFFPPQWYMITELSKTKNVNDLVAAVGAGTFCEQGTGHVVTICPEFNKIPDDDPLRSGGFQIFTALPGDATYSRSRIAVSPEARHRLYINRKGPRFIDIKVQKNLEITALMGDDGVEKVPEASKL